MVFCPDTPFGAHIVNLYKLSTEPARYMNETAKFDIDFRGRIYDDYTFIKEKTFDRWIMPTYYHGACQVFRIRMNATEEDYFALTFNSTSTDLALYLFEEGDEFYLITNDFLTPTSPVILSSSSTLRFNVIREEKVSTEQHSCRDYTPKEHLQCLLDMYLENAGNKSCAGMLFEGYFPGLSPCPVHPFEPKVAEISEKEAKESEHIFMDSTPLLISSRYAKNDGHGKCPQPCKRTKYQVEHILNDHMDEEALKGKVLYFGFASKVDTVTTEYFLHNFTSITAAVGGAVGLFLGISVLELVNRLLDKISIFQRRNENDKNKSTPKIKRVAPI